MNRIVHLGHLTSRGALLRRALLMVGVAIAWLIVFLVIPCLLLVALGFTARQTYGQPDWGTWTFDHYWRILGYNIFGWSADYLRILGESALIAAVTTALCVLIAYPLAFFIANRPPRQRYLWLALILIPFSTNIVIRTYAWMLILDHRLPPARLAQWVGFVDEGRALYPGNLAIYLGMVTMSLPFAVLPIYAAVEKLDWSIVDAARDLYASRWRTIKSAILPQTMPGLSVAVVLTFVPALGAYVVPALLGGGRKMLIGNLIAQQFGASRNWPLGAAIATVLVAVTLLALILIRRRREGIELA